MPIILRASHDGYADRFKVVHQRALKLALDGNRLDGEDLFVSTDGDMIPQDVADEFAVRFHLHPSVKANKLTDGHGAMLMLPNRDGLDLQRLRGPRRDRGKRLPLRLRRAAPRGADRDLRPRPEDLRGCTGACRSPPPAAPAAPGAGAKSPNCPLPRRD